MTIHSDIDYFCPYCEASYVPYSKEMPCPNCGEDVEEYFEGFLEECTQSCVFNLEYFHSYQTSYWIPNNIGDVVFWGVFGLLEEYRLRWFDLSYQKLVEKIKSIPEEDSDEEEWINFYNSQQYCYGQWTVEMNLAPSSSIEELLEDKPSWWLTYLIDLSLNIYDQITNRYCYLELFSIGSIYYADNEFLHSLRLYEKARKLKSNYFLAFEKLLDSSFELKDYWRVILHFENNNVFDEKQVSRLLPDIAFAKSQERKYEEAIFYYEKAISIYDHAIQELKRNKYITTATKIYKVDVDQDVLKCVTGIGSKFIGKSIGEQTISDLHIGLANAYEQQYEFDTAISHYKQAANLILTKEEFNNLKYINEPYYVSFYGNDNKKILQLAEKARKKKYIISPFLPIIGLWRILKG